jgi:hypothetical protein
MNKYLILLILVTPSISYSKEDVKKTPKKYKAQSTIEFNCGAATSQAVLDINNVRTIEQNDGLPLCQFSINGDYSSLNAPEMETSKTKKLVKIVNFIGQEVLLDNINIDMPYIEIYDDGSEIKKFKTE